MKKQLLVLKASLISILAFSQCYTVTQIPYVSDTTTLTAQAEVQVTDDHWSDVVPIGFTFCFYGNQYDSVIIGDNGLISFETQNALNYCVWPISAAAPSAVLTAMKNAIGVPYQDLCLFINPNQKIYSWTSGMAPNRKFIVYYDSIPMYSCTTMYYCGYVTLYEGSNNIEIQEMQKDACQGWNGGAAILGIQNQTGTQATIAPGHNYPFPWTDVMEGWLITPICNVCQGVGTAENPLGSDFSVYPNPSKGIFTLQIQNTTIASFEVVDISGRIVHSEKVNPQTQQQIQFTLENSGMYFIRVYDDANTMLKSEKIVVE